VNWIGAELQIQAIDESAVMVNVVEVPVPVVGTLPVPVQPVQVQTKFPSVTGLVMLAVIEVP
jgi:hypothetical protein